MPAVRADPRRPCRAGRRGAPGDRRHARRASRDPLRAASGRARRRLTSASDPGSRRARVRLQGSRRRDRAAQSPAARGGGGGRGDRRGGGAPPPDIRVRRSRLRGRRSARRALRPPARRAPLLSTAQAGAVTLGARRRRTVDPARDPEPTRRICGEGARAPRCRHPGLDDARVRRRGRRDAIGRRADRYAHARVDCGRASEPAARRTRPAARRARPNPRRRLPPCRRASRDLGARRLCRRAERSDTGHRRPADVPARAAPGETACEESDGDPGAVSLPDAGPGGDARPLQGDRRCSRPSLPRLSRLVGDALVPPPPAPARLPQAARGHRLDRRALLPP